MSSTSVLIVDDSAFMRKMLTEIIEREGSLTVAGTARDGADALRKVETLRPDVITLDVEMPVMDGYATLIELMKRGSHRVLMVSSLTHTGADITLRCLAAGAIDFVSKPSGSISLDIERIAGEIVSKIKVAAVSRVSSTPHQTTPPARPIPPVSHAPQSAVAPARRPVESIVKRAAAIKPAASVLVIGASTGGPRALNTLVTGLGMGLRIPAIIVQHMPAGFTNSLANRLDAAGSLNVREAVDGDSLEPGTILVAPGGFHLVVKPDTTIHLSTEPPIHGVRPSIDVTLESVARIFGAHATAVLLTGMGKDGARGMKLLRDMGAHTFAEDESTCVVYGMPKAAAEIDAVETILPIHELAPAVIAATESHGSARGIADAA